ncbi:hypothetical protein ABZ907_16220 [Nonomuraea wenchangensis]
MRTRLLRTGQVAIAAAATAIAMAGPAEAHSFRIGNDWGFAEISSNHANLNVCRILGNWPDSDVWGTVRYSGGTLIRYDAPTLSGLCYNHTLRSNPTDVRFCWRPSGTNNQCTAWKAV